MASQKGGGIGLIIGLAVSIFLCIVLAVLLFLKQSETDQEKKKVESAEQKYEDVAKKERGYIVKIQALNNIIWSQSTDVELPMIKRDLLDEAGKRIAEVLNKEELFGEEFAKSLTNKEGIKLQKREYKNLKEMYQDLFLALDAVVSQLNLLRMQKISALADAETEKTNARTSVAELNKQIDSLRKEKGDLVNKNLSDAKQFDGEKRRLMDEKEAVLAEKTKQEETAAISEAKIRSEVSALNSRIAELTEKKRRTLAETEPDGEIVYADQKLGLAWVNLGQEDRLRRGTAFEVFQYVKGGARKIKGHVEIRAIEDTHSSQVAILDQLDAADPIVKGDLIASPFYDKKKTMHFVFVGEKLTNDRYGMEELVRRIEETGSKVDKNVNIETDFVVAIENAEQQEEFAKAVQFGVVIMREPELLEFLGR
jgi:hypothetical protein